MKTFYLIQLIILMSVFYEVARSADFEVTDEETALQKNKTTEGNADPDENGIIFSPNTQFNLADEVRTYQLRYKLRNLHEKLTDNRGRGSKELYGTRNFRVVLPGVLYRGGANNVYLNNPRSNMNPLPSAGLKNLCKEKFSASVYLYSEHFSRAPHSIACVSKSRNYNKLKYRQYSAAAEKEKIIALVYKRIKGQLPGPVFVHCWNGWHASGLISGIVLKQFCNWSNSRAEAYWAKNTDGNYSGHPRTRARLRAFKPYAKYAITAKEKALICPKD